MSDIGLRPSTPDNRSGQPFVDAGYSRRLLAADLLLTLVLRLVRRRRRRGIPVASVWSRVSAAKRCRDGEVDEDEGFDDDLISCKQTPNK
ncbi:hypothetical protein MUK42_18463 [Musa troglodytarum]|uniref:Uncharacterized protein n=1 Tax=Musa troglodytarum TaxID=320322 RepID=A0A9E7FAD8_9LILI|nr:hypothetical protein MUK42_18463 [Musa troglodytarum]